MMDPSFANFTLPPRLPPVQTSSQILPPSSIQQPTLEDQFPVGSLQIPRPGELPLNQTFSPVHEAPMNYSQPYQPIEGKILPNGLTFPIPPSALRQLSPTFSPPFVPPSYNYTMRRAQCERMWEMNSRLQTPQSLQYASPNFRADMIRHRSHYGSSWQAQYRRNLQNHSPMQTFSPLHTSLPLQKPRRLRAPTTIPPSSPHMSHFQAFPPNYTIDHPPSAVTSRFIPCSWETTSRRMQIEQPQHHHQGVDLLPSQNPELSTRMPYVCAGNALEDSLLVPRPLAWPPAYPTGYCSESFSISRRTSRSFPENKKMSRIIEDEESEEDLEPIDEIDSESSLRDRLPDLNELVVLPDVVLGAISAATNDEANEAQERIPEASPSIDILRN